MASDRQTGSDRRAAEIPLPWQRGIEELLAQLPPMTDEDCRRAAAILSTATPPKRQVRS